MRERGEIIYTRIADIDTSWMKTFNTDMIGGFEQNSVKVRVIPERGTTQGYREDDVFAHRLHVLSAFSQTTVTDADTLFVSCPLRCSLDQLMWVCEAVKEKKPTVACYTLTGTFIDEEWVKVFTPWVCNLERIWYEKSDLIFVPTEYFRQAMLKDDYDAGKIFVVGAPVDSEKISEQSQPRNQNALVFTHRLNIDKKPTYFFRMAEDLSRQFPDLRFYISTNLGERDFWSTMDEEVAIKLKAALSQVGSLSVIFNASRKEFYDLLNTAYLAPCFSTHETFGFSVAESLAAGCIPVVPERLTYPELVNGDPDFMYTSSGNPEGDYQSALKKTIDFVEHPQLGQEVSDKARRLVERFKPKNVVGRMLKIMDRYDKEVRHGRS